MRNPTVWAVAAWVFLMMWFSTPLSARAWYPDTAILGMALCALVSLITGTIQRRGHPEATRAWQYLLAGLVLIVVGAAVLLPAL